VVPRGFVQKPRLILTGLLAGASSIGARLLTRKMESQQRDGVTTANLLNLWNLFGRCVCVNNG
jgi:hypothetical protein